MGADKKPEKRAETAAEAAPEDAHAVQEKIDFSHVKIEPIFAETVDFDTFAKSDFRAVKILACEAVPKSKKLLKFTLDDGERKDRVILSGIHEYYEPEELVGKTAIAIVNLPARKMMGIDSEGMLISAVHEEDGHEGLNLLGGRSPHPGGREVVLIPAELANRRLKWRIWGFLRHMPRRVAKIPVMTPMGRQKPPGMNLD